MLSSNPFESIIANLRAARNDADDKRSELADIRDDVETAIDEVDTYRDELDSAIEALENIGDLRCDYSFDSSLEDFDLEPETYTRN